MKPSPASDFLLHSACPSIQYRVLTECLLVSPGDPSLSQLKTAIEENSIVRGLLAQQASDGWFAEDFHGTVSHESCLRRLLEMGIPVQSRPIQAAVEALLSFPERCDRGLGKAGRLLDELHLGGTRLIRATVLAAAGREDLAEVQEQIQEAVLGFAAVLNVPSFKEVCEIRQGQRVLRSGQAWPGLYHLRLLAFTQSWRSSENQKLLASSFEHLARLSPLLDYNGYAHGQRVAPASFCMHDFVPDLDTLDAAGWMQWLLRTELITRTGVLPFAPIYQRQISQLQKMLASSHEILRLPLSHPYFTRWSAYTGLALEADWHSPLHRECDLTFRSVLISHYAGLQ
jgi:hypothetical protein